jgi:hypothetical protein
MENFKIEMTGDCEAAIKDLTNALALLRNAAKEKARLIKKLNHEIRYLKTARWFYAPHKTKIRLKRNK